MNLNGEWKMQDFDAGQGLGYAVQAPDYDDRAWMSAQVPGDVHSSLLALGRIPDPFYEDNVEKLEWVEEREWWFRRRFAALPAQDADSRSILTFEGLDLFATIYLNGEEIYRHANMFRPAELDVTGRLHQDRENVLALRFDPLRRHITKEELSPQMPEYDSHSRVQVRKAQAQFMWDHTPTCLMIGLWQGVHLDTYQTARLHFPHFRVLNLDQGQAVLSVDSVVEHWGQGRDLQVEVSLSLQAAFQHLAGDTQQTIQARATVRDGRARSIMVLDAPVCWYPNGYGEAALYDMLVTLRDGEQILDTFEDQVGICTIHVDQTADPEEVGSTNFTFVVNGVPIFAKGANWVPTDLFNGRVQESDYEAWLELLRDAHGNMMRVWGGGQYEPDAFHKAADRMGILIWQDFMFAGASYPEHRTEFYEEVRKEAEFQVMRLRNRPSLALWCGNNELDWHLDEMMWDKPGAYYPGRNIMHTLLPDVVQRLDPDHLYWPSSPYGGSDHNSSLAGDKHNWQTWHAIADRPFGEKPGSIADYSNPAEAISYWHLGRDQGRFISEFGIHASPIHETLRRNIGEAGLAYNSPEMRFRNRNIIQDRGDLMMEAHTGLPTSLDDYIDFSMMTQAEGLKHGIEHYRRRKFHCSGALFWQWNDNWPSITWSVLDYYRFPKAGYFFVKRAFAPVMLSVRKDEAGQYSIWGVNDTLQPVEDTLIWRHLSFDGALCDSDTLPFSLPPNSAMELLRFDQDRFSTAQADEMLWLHSVQGSFPDNRHFFAPELRDLKREKPALHVTWEQRDDRLLACLKADAHAYFVNLLLPIEDTRYSDNWIDLYPGVEARIEIWHPAFPIFSPDDVQIRWR